MIAQERTDLDLGLDPRPAAERDDLDLQMVRLRLLLRRRALWLRRLWGDDPLRPYQDLVIGDARADRLLAGEDPRAAARFVRDDPEAAPLTAELAAVERELAERTRAQPVGRRSASATLAELCGLTPFERDVLLLCLAPELDPAFSRLYAYLHDDVQRPYPSPQLALELFGDPEAEACRRDSFLPEGPLRRFRLIEVEAGPAPGTPFAARPLRLPERVADYLRGVNRPDERVAELLRPIPWLPLAPAAVGLIEELVTAIQADAWRGAWPAINLVGPPGAGKRAVARGLGDRLGVQPAALDLGLVPPPGPEREALLRLLEREAVLLRLVFYLDAGREIRERGVGSTAADLIERLGAFLIVGGEEVWRGERPLLAVPMPKPDVAAQGVLWRQALAAAADEPPAATDELDGAIAAITQQFDLGPVTIARAAAAAHLRTRRRGGGELRPGDLWQACRDETGGRLRELAQPIVSPATWADLVLPEDALRQLREIADQVAHRATVYGAWDFGRRHSRGLGIAALFAGPSGTGKTLAAEILANHLGLDLYRIDLAGVVSKYIGETEKNLRRIFDLAEQGGAILFFDEADALFGKRTEVKDSHDRYANIEIDYLLQRMEDYRGLAILATNRKADLDRAFLRRLRFLVDFPFPDAEQRRRIWQRMFPPAAPTAGLDFAALARLQVAGGNIRTIALNAAFLAAGADEPIRMSHLFHAARREYAKIDKLVTEAEFGRQAPAAKR